MPKFSVDVPHKLGREAAIEKLDTLMQRVAEMYRDQVKDIEQHWEENKLLFSFRTLGLTVSGQTVVDDDQVAVTGKLPIAAMMFKGKIEKDIRTQLEKLLR
jgi:putative polyhydroxyalkanoate system protein